jgi:hypothetical protein
MKPIVVLKVVSIFLLLALMGCEENLNDQTFTLGKASNMRLGLLYTSTDGQYTLIIKEINDSRCPQGVVCVWAGEVILKGEWTKNSLKSTFELHSVMEGSQNQPDGFTIRIQDVKPYPVAETTTRPEDLVITLLIQKN